MKYFLVYSSRLASGKITAHCLPVIKKGKTGESAIEFFDDFVATEIELCRQSGTEFQGMTLISVDRGKVEIVREHLAS